MTKYSIVVSSHNAEVLNNNLLKSPDIFNHDLHIKFGYTNVCKAYNEAINECSENIIIFVHHDVLLPDTFFNDLELSLNKLNNTNWGVLGSAGIRINGIASANVTDRGFLFRTIESKPTLVNTMDELILVVRKSSFPILKFDENIINNHLFGTDICLQARKQGMTNYIVDIHCFHNSSLVTIPANYYDTEKYIRKKWKCYLPIYTTCSNIR